MSYNPQNPNGQATMAASAPVVIASNQSTLTISGSVTLSAGTSIVGKFGVDQTTNGTTNAVFVNNFPGTQAISGSVALNAGSNLIGKVGIDQTTNGTTNAVFVNNFPATQAISGSVALNAGSNVIGKVGIDQTTPGTTNLVQVGGSLPAGTNNIGTVAITGTQSAATTGSWTSATTLNTALTLTTTNLNTVSVAVVVPATMSAGALTFEVSPDNANWFPVQMARLDSYTVESVYTLVASANRAWSTSVDGFTNFRVRLSTVITGTGNLVVVIIPQTFAIEPIVSVGQATASLLNTTCNQQPITKGTQGATGITTQDLKDAGRNQTNYFMALPVVSTATDTLMSLTGYKSGAAVAATTTPAVVTAGKTYRIKCITITYVAIATAGTVRFTLRANTGGVAAVTSPAVATYFIGGQSATAGVAETVCIAIPDGLEFAAGTGIGVSMQGYGSTQVAAAVGYGQINIEGYEY